MPRGDARTRLVNVPKEFLPLIEAETEERVFFSTVHTMGLILNQHFKLKELSWSKLCQEAEVSPDAPIMLKLKHTLEQYLTFADEGPGQPTKPKQPKVAVKGTIRES